MLIRDDVERFLREHNMAPSLFGRLAFKDPRFVSDLRKGRTPSAKTAAKARAFMEGYK